jgi:hypothetical protein
MVARIEEKKHLSAKGLLKRVRDVFANVEDSEKGKGSQSPDIPLVRAGSFWNEVSFPAPI